MTTATDLATFSGNTALAAAWSKNATALKAKFNEAFWLEDAGLYRDNQTTTLCPQDANSFAVLYNLTTSLTQASRISEGLEKNWNDLGPVAPELPDTISPFIGGFEASLATSMTAFINIETMCSFKPILSLETMHEPWTS